MSELATAGTALPRRQHIVASGIVAAVGVWVAWISWTAQPAEALLFPRLVSSIFALLALWTFAKALLGRTRVGNGLSAEALGRLAPGLLVALVYLFWAAEAVGFYTATAVSVFAIIALYDPAPRGKPSTWARYLVITAVFLAVMYGLFSALLNVFTPREILF